MSYEDTSKVGQTLQFDIEGQYPAFGPCVLGVESIAKTDRHPGASHLLIEEVELWLSVENKAISKRPK